jgi:glycosyltransferase involved in cell wall biosynthesis
MVAMSAERDTLVSVVIPVYNAEPFLRPCVESVLAQTLADIEVICVDDGSTDASLRTLAGFADADERVRVLRQERGGGGAARNRGLREATGRYLAFLDADDCFEPTMLAEMVAEAEERQSDIVLCRTATFSDEAPQPILLKDSIRGLESGRSYTPEELQDRAFHYCVGWPWDKLFRRAFVLEHELEFQPLMSSNDAYFVYVALLLATSLSYIDSCLIRHRVGNPASTENRRADTWANPFFAIDAIEQRLRKEGLYERYEGAFLGWAFDFCLWNFETLGGTAKGAFLETLRDKLLVRFESIDRDKLLSDYETDYLDMLAKSHADLLQEHIVNYWKLRYAIEEVEALKARVTQLEGDIDSYEHSPSYRMGRAITFIPRTIKGKN